MAQTPNPRDSPGQDCERGYVSLGASIPEPPPWPFNISSPRHLAFSLDSLSHLSQHQTHALHSNVREWTQLQKRLHSESRQGVCKARPRDHVRRKVPHRPSASPSHAVQAASRHAWSGQHGFPSTLSCARRGTCSGGGGTDRKNKYRPCTSLTTGTRSPWYGKVRVPLSKACGK